MSDLEQADVWLYRSLNRTLDALHASTREALHCTETERTARIAAVTELLGYMTKKAKEARAVSTTEEYWLIVVRVERVDADAFHVTHGHKGRLAQWVLDEAEANHRVYGRRYIVFAAPVTAEEYERLPS